MLKAWRFTMELQAGMTEVEAWAWQTGAKVVGVDKDKNQLHRFLW